MRKSSTSVGWAVVLAGVVVGPVAGAVLVLLAKPLAGVAGIPGAVSWYVSLSAFVLGCLAAAGCLRIRGGVSSAFAGACALVAGGALILAAAVPGVAAFSPGILIAGIAAGPLLVVGRAMPLGRDRAAGIWYALMAAGLAIGSALAGACARRPGLALLVVGGTAAVFGILLLFGRFRSVIHTDPPMAALWPVVPGYFAAGLAAGHVVLPALHLLLFRWNVLDAEQWPWLASACVPAGVLVLVRRDPAAVAPLLILAAGGGILVATAPGPVALAIGLAVTVAATARALATLDDAVAVAAAAPSVRLSAAGALITACGGLAGLGSVAGVGRVWGTGSALTLFAVTVGGLAVLTGRRMAMPAPDATTGRLAITERTR
ncbi:hypothetical protein NDR87_03465 [Nocardia sp. CDC159]|uniref:Uncharacterized protein n=1 Tax=Nocardia pulmonis TaxID=2951408 RepID=A0A9X2IWI5_9NOCA|nr:MULTISPECIES: hypothetical protein [Nocardia]MCM6771926.1 hypothetical protein [Nocardia pulmonis]MCM6785416.1 hypothetical protein [Nocardia sp. CDC159]